MIVGTEWLIEAAGCNEEHLRDESLLRDLFDRVIRDLGLNSIGSVWHKFPGEGGVTGLVALTESHLACHTYPEHRTATFNLYCCRTRPEWDWEFNLKAILGASEVSVTKIERGEATIEKARQEFEISDLKFESSNQSHQQTVNRIPEISKSISEISDLNFEIAESQTPNPKSQIAHGGDV